MFLCRASYFKNLYSSIKRRVLLDIRVVHFAKYEESYPAAIFLEAFYLVIKDNEKKLEKVII